MIKDIQEYFGAEGQWATLHQATVSLVDMGDRTISTQVKIDGDHVPDFSGWELSFKGERFILPIREPQAAKDNTSLNSLVDLTFYSWGTYQLKRYFFVSLTQIESGVEVADKYTASVILPVESFVQLFNRVLRYYFGDKIRMDLFQAGQGIYSTNPVAVEINHTYIWDVLTKFYEIFGLRWRMEYEQSTGTYVIKVNYAAEDISDHDFEYGYQGGLIRFERQVQDDNINNILLGRGGERNLPYRYFKRVDPQNPNWAADPDAIPELANIYFDRLRDINFRRYVQGWRTNPNRDTSWEEVQPYDASRAVTDWAYAKGHTDATFSPVEYVKDDESIAKYGERWGALDDNDDIYPSIQGIGNSGLGRVDEVVAVSDIATDDIDASAQAEAVETNLGGVKSKTINVSRNGGTAQDSFRGTEFTVGEDMTATLYGRISHVANRRIRHEGDPTGEEDTAMVNIDEWRLSIYDASTGSLVKSSTNGIVAAIPTGRYYLEVSATITNNASVALNVTYSIDGLRLVSSSIAENAWKPTFDIWLKNIWETTPTAGENDTQYAERVWGPILGDRAGNEAKIVFSDGFMSVSEDYEFVIAAYPVRDTSKELPSGVHSEWKLTLYKSDAEFQATGLFIPNASTGGKPVAGDHFFFTGIDMPHKYVVWGEEQVNAKKTEELENISDINPTWIIALDKVRVHTIEDADNNIALADRLQAGTLVTIKDKRFTHDARLSLYVQSITYTWNEPSDGSPYLVPDIEVVLSDKVVSSESPVARLNNDVSVIRSTYAKTSDIESVVRRVATPLFLKKTGESDSSDSPTSFGSSVKSKDFRQGDIGGAGWGHYLDGEGNAVLEIDKLIVRKDLAVNSLVANQISYVGGRQIISAASIQCTQVVETDSGYVCYFDQKQGSVANLFQVGDIAMGQMFDPENNEERYYRAVVTAVSDNSITLSKTQKDGEGIPEAGDTIVQYGSISDPTRQYVIIRDVIGGGYERMLSELQTPASAGKEYYLVGRQNGSTPRWFVGDSAGEYAEYLNGQLNIKGRISVMKSDGTYQSMSDYITNIQNVTDNLQSQIDGAVQTWSTEGEPTLQNYPASSWTDVATKNNHIGDLYYDLETGHGYRFMYTEGDGFFWFQLTDEDVTTALAEAARANQGVAGLQYLKTALADGSTIVEGGLVLTNLIQLGKEESGVFNVYSGINGLMDPSARGNGIAAWYGGPMTDHEADASAASYAKSLFRFDGSGYLASGNIGWDASGAGHIPGISWEGNSVIISGDVKLASLSGDSVTELLSLVRNLNNWFGEDENGDVYVKRDGTRNRNFYTFGQVAAGGLATDSGGGGSIDLDRVWESLTNNTDKPDVLINPAHYLNNYLSGVSGSGNGTVTFARNSLASLTWDASHTHTIAQVGGLQSALDAKMDDGDVTLDGSVLTVKGVSIDIATASGVEALANAIAGNSVRLHSIEDWFTHPALEELTVHALNVEDVINGRIDWGNVLNTPTTLSGYGITDAVPSSRKVNGHALTSDVTVTKSDVGLGNVENTALSTWGGSANIATLGTITSGTWHGEKIANDYLVNKTIGVGGATIALGGSATLSQIGVAQWAQTQDAAIAYSALPNLYIGTTRVQASSVAQALTGITTISASGLATILGGISLGGTYDDADSKLIWDAEHSAWHLIGNLYADGFITAGGINGSGGGSSVDLARVWESLTNNTDYPDVLINAAHIPVTLAGTTLTVGGTSIDIATATDLSAYVNAAGYNSASKQIELKHGTTVVATVDATEFLKDGMVSNVTISGGYLTISFNTDAGKEDIRIPLDDIFDADNYYTKSESDSRFFLASNFTQSNIQSTLGISAWAMAASKPSYTFSEIGSKPTTLSGYGITDAHITDGVITLGDNTITPLTQHQSLADYYTKAEVIAQVLPLSQGVADAAARIASIEDWFLMPSLEELLVRDLNVENAINADLAGNADTATILRTARTINGTSFDGSADIVTATWGTARNISISDADATNTGDAVSVNGGAAATLKLPSTIKAALSGNASSASRLAGAGTFSAWGRTFWQNGVPQSVSGAIEGATTINASDAITLSGSTNTARRIYFGDSEHYLELDSYGFHFSHGVYSDDFVAAHGIGSGGGGGGGLIETLYRYADLGGTFSDSTNDTFNAYTINKINTDLSARIVSLEDGSAMSIVTEGNGNVVSGVSKSGTVVTVTKGITALTEHQSLDALALKTTTITGTGYLVGGGSLAANRTIDIADAYKTQIGEGHAAYGWGNHADAGYALASDVYSASATRAANTVLAAPNGSNGAASFRALVAADIPSLTTGKISDIETWIAAKGYSTTTGTVTSVALSAPTGFAVSGSPVTSSGTLALSFASGYSLPTTAKQGQWDTAYGWGNHASAGYLKGIDSEMIENALGYIPMNEEDAYTKTMADMQVLALSEGISANDARLRSIEDWFAAPALEELFVTDLNVENTINGQIEWGNILNKSITLTGHITGTGGNTIATTIGAGVVTNAMLAGSIANSKLVNSAITLAGTVVSLGGSFSVDQMQDAAGIIALVEGVAANSARIKSIEEWLESPSLEELFVTDLNVANTINGNAATATTLQTTRTIWGQSFDGSGNISGAISNITTISASGLATISGGIALGTSTKAQAAKMVWDETNNAWHLQGNLYVDGFVAAGGINNQE